MARDISKIHKVIGENVKSMRKSKNWTQKELGERAGLPISQISKIENGKYKNPTIKTLLALSESFGVPVECLLISPREKDKRGESDPEPLRELICKGKFSEQDIEVLRCLQRHGIRLKSEEDYICLWHIIKNLRDKD